MTLSGPGLGCKGIKDTFEEPEGDSERPRRVVSMITRSGETFEFVFMKANPGPRMNPLPD